MSDIQHGRRIITQSYYDGAVASSREELEISQFSSKETLLRDMIEAMSVINTGETTKLDLCIQIDKQQRYRIVKKWTVQK